MGKSIHNSPETEQACLQSSTSQSNLKFPRAYFLVINMVGPLLLPPFRGVRKEEGALTTVYLSVRSQKSNQSVVSVFGSCCLLCFQAGKSSKLSAPSGKMSVSSSKLHLREEVKSVCGGRSLRVQAPVGSSHFVELVSYDFTSQ